MFDMDTNFKFRNLKSYSDTNGQFHKFSDNNYYHKQKIKLKTKEKWKTEKDNEQQKA